MKHNIFYDEYSKKEIDYVVFPDDPFVGADIEIEISAVTDKNGRYIAWTDKEADEWTDEIIRRLKA